MTSGRIGFTVVTVASTIAVAIAWPVVAGQPAGGAPLASSTGVAVVSFAVQLNAVSCVTATACFAVGEGSTGRPLAPVTTVTERWNGHSWVVMASPNPSGAKNSHLDVVSCTTTTFCMAVGRSAATKTSQTELVERWNGTKWSIVPTPNSTQSGLGGVSCTTARFCMAVGEQVTRADGNVTRGRGHCSTQ